MQDLVNKKTKKMQVLF